MRIAKEEPGKLVVDNLDTYAIVVFICLVFVGLGIFIAIFPDPRYDASQIGGFFVAVIGAIVAFAFYFEKNTFDTGAGKITVEKKRLLIPATKQEVALGDVEKVIMQEFVKQSHRKGHTTTTRGYYFILSMKNGTTVNLGETGLAKGILYSFFRNDPQEIAKKITECTGLPVEERGVPSIGDISAMMKGDFSSLKNMQPGNK